MTAAFEGLGIKKSRVHEFMKDECNLSLKAATLHLGPRNDEKKLEKRSKWAEAWMNTDMDFTKSCIFIDESGFDISMRHSRAWSRKGTEAIIPTASIRVVSYTVIGSISAIGVVNITMRVPMPPKKLRSKVVKKIKLPHLKLPKRNVQQLAIILILSERYWTSWTDILKLKVFTLLWIMARSIHRVK